MLSETNQTEKEKCHIISFICVILKQKASSEMLSTSWLPEVGGFGVGKGNQKV